MQGAFKACGVMVTVHRVHTISILPGFKVRRERPGGRPKVVALQGNAAPGFFYFRITAEHLPEAFMTVTD